MPNLAAREAIFIIEPLLFSLIIGDIALQQFQSPLTLTFIALSH
jgi:hypothetical protein